MTEMTAVSGNCLDLLTSSILGRNARKAGSRGVSLAASNGKPDLEKCNEESLNASREGRRQGPPVLVLWLRDGRLGEPAVLLFSPAPWLHCHCCGC